MLPRYIADEIMTVVGPCRCLLICQAAQTLSAVLLEGGCEVRTATISGGGSWPELGMWDCVVLQNTPVLRDLGPERLCRQLRPNISRYLVVINELENCPGVALKRSDWEEGALRAGYRRSLSACSLSQYSAWNDERTPLLSYFEIIPEDVLARRPLAALMQSRDLHMDHARESSPRADAHLARYALASEWIRSRDTVLDCACGLGYGSALMSVRSRGKRFIGVDISAEAIAYASDMYGGHGIEFHRASSTGMGFLPDSSVDCIVSFETIEHLQEFMPMLEEFARVLRPDGRLIVSVPNLWMDESGHDPSPYHFHTFDWNRLRTILSGEFLLEARYRQETSGGKLATAPRRLERVALDAPDTLETEWWIAVASADPRKQVSRGYSHPAFGGDHPPADIVDFAHFYKNPWLYRSMIQSAERLEEPALLRQLARSVICGDGSADDGAALCVLGYDALATGGAIKAEHISEIDGYLSRGSDGNPHIRRWQLSLAFLSALLVLRNGDREGARARFLCAALMDPLDFSPLLATKTVLAYLRLGCMAMADGDREQARSMFLAGCEASRRALHADDREAIGDPGSPLLFGFQELAEVADLGGRCAFALLWIEESSNWSMGRFWRWAETKRFGLLSSLLVQEREMAKLRAQVEENGYRIAELKHYQNQGVHGGAAKLAVALARDLLPGERPIIFGCGTMGRDLARLLSQCGIVASCLTDNEPGYWGQIIEGLEVWPPERALANLACSPIAIASYTFADEIIESINRIKVGNAPRTYRP